MKKMLVVLVLLLPSAKDALAESSPWQNFDLSGWYITLPVNKDGQKGGHDAVSVYPINSDNMGAIPGSSTYFFTSPDGGMTFYAPVDGARSFNSGPHHDAVTTYPRCELREMDYLARHAYGGIDDSIANFMRGSDWPLSYGGTMEATIAVNQIPAIIPLSNGKTPLPYIVIGQIHGNRGELCKLTYVTGAGKAIKGADGTKIKYNIFFNYVNLPQVHDTSFGLVPMSEAITLGQKFSYRIQVQNNTLTVSVTADGKTYSVSPPLDPSWLDAGGNHYEFKAGVYDGADSSGEKTQGTGAGEVTFYHLEVHH